VNFKKFAEYLSRLEAISSRNEITVVLADLLKELSVEEVDKAIYLSLGELAPAYENLEIGVAEKIMSRVISKAFGVSEEEAWIKYKKAGDWGIVAQEERGKVDSSQKALSISEVYQRLVAVAGEGGNGSQDKKIEGICELFRELDTLSCRFVARIPVGALRLGFSELTVIDALSVMATGDKGAKKQLEMAYQVMSDVGKFAKKIKEEGLEKATKHIRPIVGVPVMPMLAQRLTSASEIVDKMGRVAVEPKLDGVRVLIHFKRGKNGFVKAFTRNLNDISEMFPELQTLSEHVDAHEVILDGEAIGMDEQRKSLVDFQTTMRRRRKYDIAELSSKVPLSFYLFDILLSDSKDFMHRSYLERRDELARIVKVGGSVKIVENMVTDDPNEIAKLHRLRLADGLEGIVAKKVDSEYVPGRTGWRWVKMKNDDSSAGKLSDTVDCVIMGYSSGRGKRAGFGIGNFLVGVVDGEKIKTITSVGSGLTDDEFKQLAEKLAAMSVREMPKDYEVKKTQQPDSWVRPKLVVEIAGDDISKSTEHTSGYAVRFPRMIKIRGDKSVAQATTIGEIASLFEMQKQSAG